MSDPRAIRADRPTPLAPLRTLLTAPVAVLLGCLLAGCAGTSSAQITSGVDEGPDEDSSESVTTTTAAPDCAATLPNSAKAGMLTMVLVEAPTHAEDLLASAKVSGYSMVGPQRSDVEEAIAAMADVAPLPPIVSVDEEGGEVQRLKWSAGEFPSAAEIGEGTVADASEAVAEHASTMAGMGVTMNLNPVADLSGGSVIDTRSYGSDPEVVSDFVVGVIEAQTGAGLTSVVKHWPGLRTATDDPHDSLPSVAPIDQLRQLDLIPFDAAIAAEVPAVMVTHVVIPGLTEADEPASLSRAAITDELRTRQGFDGIVISDSLGMDAITDQLSEAEAAVRAVAAGTDIVLVSSVSDAEETHDRLVQAIETGELDADRVEESVRRVLALKGIEGECFDLVSTFAAASRAEAADSQSTDSSGGTSPGNGQTGTGQTGAEQSGTGGAD